MPDGQQFVGVVVSEDLENVGRALEIQVILNWFEELERLVPAN